MSTSANKLVVAIASRALLDLDDANRVFETQGLAAYRDHQRANERAPLERGTAFDLAQRLLRINALGQGELVDVVLLSRNDPDTGLRAMNSLEHHGLPVKRACFTGGRSAWQYLRPLSVNLFLSAHEADVESAIAHGFAAALALPKRPTTADAPNDPSPGMAERTEVRLAFDGDSVLFSGEAEEMYRREGLAAFHRQEAEQADVALAPGPFQPFLGALHHVQSLFADGACPIRTALVTARSAPAHKRAIQTLRHWNVRVDEAFFLGDLSKAGVLAAFGPDIYFDDHPDHCLGARDLVPTARVPRVAPLEKEPPPE